MPQKIDPRFIYEVSSLGVKGHTAGWIARRMNYGRPVGAKSIPNTVKSAFQAKVRGALTRAHTEGILVLNPPRVQRLEESLQKRWPRIKFTIVESNEYLDADSAVHLAASDVLSGMIKDLWTASAPDLQELVIANAGGRAVSETVRCISERNRTILQPSSDKSMAFISLNSAGRARAFERTSNYLAVRLAEGYGQRHIAVLGTADISAREEYDRLVKNISLLVCGAGGKESLLAERAHEANIEIPKDFAGDLAFLPIDKDGRELKNKQLRDFAVKHLYAAPAYDEIKRIIHSPRTVLVILSGKSKHSIALALLRGVLASNIVMDTALADSLLA